MQEGNGIWIPAEVWALDLPPLHRVFLARLMALSKQEGVSWAGDDFLAESLRCTPQHVRKMRRQLEDSGHIVTDGYGHKRRLSVELAPVGAKVAPVGTSNQRNKQPEAQELQPQAQELQPQLRQEATTVAYSIEENRTSKEEVKSNAPKLKKKGNTTVVDSKAKPFDVDEVRDYMTEIGDTDLAEADKFFDYWVSKGWRDKHGPIRDWKARMRYWLRSEYRRPAKPKAGSLAAEAFKIYQNEGL